MGQRTAKTMLLASVPIKGGHAKDINEKKKPISASCCPERQGLMQLSPNTLTDKKSNIKVDLLDTCAGQMLAEACFISLVKQRKEASEHKSTNNIGTFFSGGLSELSYKGNSSRIAEMFCTEWNHCQ